MSFSNQLSSDRIPSARHVSYGHFQYRPFRWDATSTTFSGEGSAYTIKRQDEKIYDPSGQVVGSFVKQDDEWTVYTLAPPNKINSNRKNEIISEFGDADARSAFNEDLNSWVNKILTNNTTVRSHSDGDKVSNLDFDDENVGRELDKELVQERVKNNVIMTWHWALAKAAMQSNSRAMAAHESRRSARENTDKGTEVKTARSVT